MGIFKTSCFLLLCTLIVACHSSGSPLEAMDSGLPQSEPGLQGLDQARISEVNRRAAALPDLSSLLIIRNGNIVSEQYLQGTGRSTAFNVKSVSKSVLSALANSGDRSRILKHFAAVFDLLENQILASVIK